MLSSLGRTAASVLGGGSANPNSGFTTDDFPALGAGGAGAPGSGSIGGPGAVGSGGIGSGSNQSAAPGGASAGNTGVPSSLGLPPGAGMGFLGSSSNSLSANASGLGGTGVAGGLPPGANGAAEQASAVAALQHQHAAREQHRQNLLGAMQQQQQQQQPTLNSSDLNKNSASSGSSASGGANNAHAALSAAKGGFGEPERNYATKLGAGNVAINAAWLTAAQQNPAGSAANSGAGVSGAGGLPPGIGLGSTNGIDAAGASENAALQRQRAAAIAAAQAGLPQDLANSAAASSNPTGEVASSPGQQVLLSPADRFGLVGLLSIIKMQDPDLSMLALGADLSQLGLNMNSQEPLSSSFLTPWSELADAQGNGGVNGSTAPLVEPDFHLPSCYNVQPPPPAHTKIQSFSDETLFFIFYSSPRDVLQEIAAQELYNRNWRYHKDLHLWLTKEQNTEPTQKTPTFERGNYVFFDPGPWEKITKNFVLYYESLEDKPAAQAHVAQQAAAAAAHQAQQQAQARRAAAAAAAVQAQAQAQAGMAQS